MQTATVSPDGKLLAVLGDSVDGLLVDVDTGKVYISGIRSFFVMSC